MVTQCGRRLPSSPPVTLETGGTSQPHLPWQPRVDRPGERMSQDRQRLTLAGCLLSAGQRLLARRRVAEAEDGRCRAGPCARRLAELRAGGARALPGRCLGAFDQATRGHNILAPREAGASMALVEQDHTQHLAHAGDRWE
jgi:hypothetical protein